MESSFTDKQAARLDTVKVVNSAGGWNLNVINPDQVLGGSVFFYLHDAATGKLWTASVAKPMFHKARKELEEVCIEVAASGIEKHFKEWMAAEQPDPTLDTTLATFVTAYISKTQTYQLTVNATLSQHFVCIHYNSSGYIRPFAMMGNDRFLNPVDEVLNAIETVISRDRKAHPEWAC